MLTPQHALWHSAFFDIQTCLCPSSQAHSALHCDAHTSMQTCLCPSSQAHSALRCDAHTYMQTCLCSSSQAHSALRRDAHTSMQTCSHVFVEAHTHVCALHCDAHSGMQTCLCPSSQAHDALRYAFRHADILCPGAFQLLCRFADSGLSGSQQQCECSPVLSEEEQVAPHTFKQQCDEFHCQVHVTTVKLLVICCAGLLTLDCQAASSNVSAHLYSVRESKLGRAPAHTFKEQLLLDPPGKKSSAFNFIRLLPTIMTMIISTLDTVVVIASWGKCQLTPSRSSCCWNRQVHNC